MAANIVRRSGSALLIAAALASCATAQKGAAPDRISFSLPDVSGRPIRSEDYAGKVLLVDLWATWCKPCVHSMPFYADLQRRFEARGFTVLAVSVDEHDEDVTAFLADRGLPFPVLRDPQGRVPAMLEVAIDTMPTAVIVGRDGRIVHVHSGFVDEDKESLEAKIVAALETR